jgi:hypothetical protein
VEECTYFWGVNTSWGINMAESKDLSIRKIIRLHNQHQKPLEILKKGEGHSLTKGAIQVLLKHTEINETNIFPNTKPSKNCKEEVMSNSIKFISHIDFDNHYFLPLNPIGMDGLLN